MSDRYQLFANSPAGRLLTRNLGLPAPLVLDRFDASKPLVNGAVLLGAAPNAELIAPIAMDEGLRFAIREGGKTVGAGVVTKIVE